MQTHTTTHSRRASADPTCLLLNKWDLFPRATQLLFADCQEIKLLSASTQLWEPSTPPASIQGVQEASGQANAPHVPPSHPDEHGEHADEDTPPSIEYGLPCGHMVHTAALPSLYLPGGHGSPTADEEPRGQYRPGVEHTPVQLAAPVAALNRPAGQGMQND